MTIRRLTAAPITALLAVTTLAAPVSAFPPEDARYLDHAEMAASVREIAERKPGIARVFSIGTSYEGRELWAATVSDHVDIDEDEPEVLFDGGMHGREHMSTEMAVALFRNLVNGHGTDRHITELVDETEITILFSLNPDGSEYDHASGTILSWRKNRQPTSGSSEIGTDINRNFGYHWGTNPLNASPSVWTYRGPSPWSTPEASAFKRYVDGRVIGGEQQIRVHVTFHQHGRIVLYPYGYTEEPIPADMDADDHLRLRTMATEMAKLSGYDVGQSSSGEIHVGNQMDWLYGTYRILTFTIEMGDAFHMPADTIPTETGRNMETAYYAIEQASLMADADRRQEARRPPSTVPTFRGLFCF